MSALKSQLHPGLLVGIWPPIPLPFPPPIPGCAEEGTPDFSAWEGWDRADFLELRWDLLVPFDEADPSTGLNRVWDIARAWKTRHPRGKLLFTNRLQRDGGRWPDTRAETRHGIWKRWLEALDANAPLPDWLDIEVETFDTWTAESRNRWRTAGARFLVSHHNFERAYTDSELKALWSRFLQQDGDGLKWALQPGSREEWRWLAPYLEMAAQRYALSGIFCMGETGRPSRLASPFMGCPLTYGYFGSQPAAPGQLSMTQLADGLERMQKLGASSGDWPALWRRAETALALLEGKG